MSFILNIETSSKNCSVCLSSKGKLINSFDSDDNSYRHSELLTSSIQDILNKNKMTVKELSAVSVGIGPGSFTGLRIGFSVAKGLCYPHDIPLIGISSLKILANPLIEKNKNIISLIKDKGEYYFLSKYDFEFKEIIQPKIQKIDSSFLLNIIDEQSIITVNTDDAYKFIYELVKDKVRIVKNTISSKEMIKISQISFDKKIFEGLAYVEPMYVKKPYVS